MSSSTTDAIRRGTCPGCSEPHNGKIKSCRRCGETVCLTCWIGSQVLCHQCCGDIITVDGFGSEEEWLKAGN